MTFTWSKDKDFVALSDDCPGNHATMFDPTGRRLPYLDHKSVFDDSRSQYMWAFGYGLYREGDRFVFATTDREVVGEVRGGEIQVVDVSVNVTRDAAGVPLAVNLPVMVAVPTFERASVSVGEDVSVPVAPVAVSSASIVPVVSGGRPVSPKVSVVTCAYNRPDMLREAVESMRAQTDPDWEHLIYDNGSMDPRVADTLAWAAQDRRVRVWRGDHNVDQPAKFWNFLFDRALGRYFTVLDDDNTKLPDFVRVMSGELDADPTLDIVTCGWIVRREGRRDDPYFLNLSTNADRLAVGSSCDGGAMLYRREVFERAGYFSEVLRTNEDWDWLRRAVHTSKVKNLEVCHATYRAHEPQRMTNSAKLGSDADIVRLKSRELVATLGVRLVLPEMGRLTASQRDVCSGYRHAFEEISWVTPGNDVALVVSPFQMTDEEIRQSIFGCQTVLSLHMEDPYALAANLDRVRAMRSVLPTWVATNDAATVPHYREVVGDQVITYPSLSADSSLSSWNLARDIDVLVCGYAYPSRKRFMDDLLPRLGGLRVVLVGDGWEGREKVETHPTMSLDQAHLFHARAKAVVCMHRVHGDCSDGPVEPSTVNRGFLEGYAGARVFVDSSRSRHALDDGDVVWYSGADDLEEKLRAYMTSGRAQAADDFAAKCRTLYTYRTRLARVLNCVRSPRFLAEIP